MFKPILAPNEQPDLSTIKYPLYASKKLDGIRCIFYKGQILSRSLKPIVNPQLREKFEALRKHSEEHQIVLDGEIYSPELTFQEITHYVMTKNEVLTIPEHLKFYIFDCLTDEESNVEFRDRLNFALQVSKKFPRIVEWVEQNLIYSEEAVANRFEVVLKEGCEGLILRDPKGLYKFGRGTLKEGLIYKVKPFITFDAEITGVVQATEVREGAEKTINELGRSVTSKKKDDRIAIEKACAFYVDYEGKELKVVLAMTDEEKEMVWRHREDYKGQWIEFKAMLVGAKDLPRHPVMLRFREDKR